tara:strand:+ start:232 stop:711 length:480 start_codon:yes stop_codon:yes gene_type:complete
MTTDISQGDKNIMKNMHLFDNLMGYRYGQFMWFAFWVPSLIAMSCDQTPGHDREFLFQANLMSSLTLLYYSYHQDRGNPASTPSMHALFGELLARWMLFAYHGPTNVVNSSTIGVMNWIQIVCMALFTVTKLPVSIYSVWHHDRYVDMVRNLKDQSKVY